MKIFKLFLSYDTKSENYLEKKYVLLRNLPFVCLIRICLDSLFSLIIFIYVSVTFLYVFYAFCWKNQIPEKKEEDAVHITKIEDEWNEATQA